MSQGSYQNGQIVEILSPLGKMIRIRFYSGGNSLKNAKTLGLVTKGFEKTVKGYVINVDSSNSSKIQFPKDEKLCLGLLQPYLVLQAFIHKGKSFSLELIVADSTKVKNIE